MFRVITNHVRCSIFHNSTFFLCTTLFKKKLHSKLVHLEGTEYARFIAILSAVIWGMFKEFLSHITTIITEQAWEGKKWGHTVVYWRNFFFLIIFCSSRDVNYGFALKKKICTVEQIQIQFNEAYLGYISLDRQVIPNADIMTFREKNKGFLKNTAMSLQTPSFLFIIISLFV